MPARTKRPSRFDLAILYDPDDRTAPSDERAIQKFVAAAESLEVDAEVIGRSDAGRLLEFDALFLRATTSVDHYTYRYARRAAAEGLVVIDDPVSILRCTNKVFLAEMLARAGLPAPRTVIVGGDDRDRVEREIGFPCVLKQLADRWVVIEVNDNPNVETGVEDLVLKDELYRRIMGSFLRRLEAITNVNGSRRR